MCTFKLTAKMFSRIFYLFLAFSIAQAAVTVVDGGICNVGEHGSSDPCTPVPLSARACAPPTSVNAATLSLIESFEGFVAKPAPDPIGLPTVGYGHLCKTKKCTEVPFSFPLTKANAVKLLETDVKTPISCIYKDVNNSVKLNDNQFGALVSWAFNVGCGNAASSQLISRLNKGENPNTVAAQELPKWNRGGGKVLPGLTRRRAAEVKLFQTASSKIVHPC